MQKTIENIREIYRMRDNDPVIVSWGAPFYDVEVRSRNRQYWALAMFFREVLGRLDLRGLRILDVGCGHG